MTRETTDNPAMRLSEALAAHRDRILAIAAAHGASNVRVFGSALHGEDRPDSDLDLLIDTPPGTSLLKIVGNKLAIEEALGAPVDLCTDRELHPDLRDGILAEVRPLSGAGFTRCSMSNCPAGANAAQPLEGEGRNRRAPQACGLIK